MNANELADILQQSGFLAMDFAEDAATMLRQQQAEIEALKSHPVKELTYQEINQCLAESHEDGIAVQQGFLTQQHYFAHLILRKAQERQGNK
jgi:hypothetical protein